MSDKPESNMDTVGSLGCRQLTGHCQVGYHRPGDSSGGNHHCLVVAIVGGLSNSEGVASMFRILRDFFIIVLALQGILIQRCAGCVLVLQFDLAHQSLRNEIKPLVDEARFNVNNCARAQLSLSAKCQYPRHSYSVNDGWCARFL